eukprot:6188176-Pleurochrysis_carterae.AAC.3
MLSSSTPNDPGNQRVDAISRAHDARASLRSTAQLQIAECDATRTYQCRKALGAPRPQILVRCAASWPRYAAAPFDLAHD